MSREAHVRICERLGSLTPVDSTSCTPCLGYRPPAWPGASIGFAVTTASALNRRNDTLQIR